MIARLKRVGIAALVLFTLYALRQVEAGAPEAPFLVIIAATALWTPLIVASFRRPRRAQ